MISVSAVQPLPQLISSSFAVDEVNSSSLCFSKLLTACVSFWRNSTWKFVRREGVEGGANPLRMV